MKRFFLVCICVLVGCFTLFAQNVTNVEAYQDGKQAVITYVLDETADVTVQVSIDGGQTFSAPLTKVTGDVGRGVRAGSNRIVWDILAERDRLVGNNIVFQVNASGNMYNGHKYVDLGLPSGTLWATCNVGATRPEEYGDYFAWGETTAKNEYTSSNYIYKSKPQTLPLSRDAANANWGGSWRMPTLEEIKELLNKNNCTWTWTSDYKGTKTAGRIVISKTNGNSIFLPAAGCRGNSSLFDAGTYGSYWSSSLDTGYPYYAYNLYFGSGNYDWNDYGYRYYGRSVRAVCSSR